MPGEPAAPRLAFVVAPARGGSTLLGRLLNAHPSVAGVGEMMRMRAALARGLPCSCGAAVRACPFWRRYLPWLEERALDYRRFDPGLYGRIAAAQGCGVIVDLSKTRVWRHPRFRRGGGALFLFLVRDSRGVVASAVRRGESAGRVLRKHVKWQRRFDRMARRLGGAALRVRYEDLCEAPRRTLGGVCAFLGLAFDEAMLRPADAEHHFVHSSRSRYLKGLNEMRVDERWRTELSAADRHRVERAMRRLPAQRAYLAPPGAGPSPGAPGVSAP